VPELDFSRVYGRVVWVWVRVCGRGADGVPAGRRRSADGVQTGCGQATVRVRPGADGTWTGYEQRLVVEWPWIVREVAENCPGLGAPGS
jgi:hypothetical protein